MRKNARKYYLYFLALLLFTFSALKNKEKTLKSLKVNLKVAIIVLPVLFFIFTLMGVIAVFVSSESIVRILGKRSGFVSILVGELLGAYTLIEPAAVFPFAGSLLEKGANYGALYGFIMSAILIGVSHIPLEVKLFGKKFMIIRNLITLIFLFVGGMITLLILGA